MINPNCESCAAKYECSTAVGYGSIMCIAKRLQSGQTKGGDRQGPSHKDMNDLRAYKEIGEPSELRKVTFCRECAIRNYDDPECPGCGNWGIPTKDDDGCTWGRTREERENEL